MMTLVRNELTTPIPHPPLPQHGPGPGPDDQNLRHRTALRATPAVDPVDQNTRHRNAHRATPAMGHIAPTPPGPTHTASPPPAPPPPTHGHPGHCQARSLLKNMGRSCGSLLTATTGPHPVRHSVGRHVLRRDLRGYSPITGAVLSAPLRSPVGPKSTTRYGTTDGHYFSGSGAPPSPSPPPGPGRPAPSTVSCRPGGRLGYSTTRPATPPPHSGPPGPSQARPPRHMVRRDHRELSRPTPTYHIHRKVG